METMSSSIEPVVPRTANLLACKQWWRVCFLYGDQQKYYRQVYGKAAAQRLALSTTIKTTVLNKDTSKNDKETNLIAATNIIGETERSSSADRDYDIITDFIEAQLGELQEYQHAAGNKIYKNNNNNESSHVTPLQDEKQQKRKHQQTQQQQQQQQQQTVPLFPAKYQSTSSTTASMTMQKSKKLLSSLRKHGHSNSKKSNKSSNKQHQEQEQKEQADNVDSLDTTKSNKRITIMDDPFLFGIDEDHLGDLIRPKQYAISATEDISKYFNFYVDEQQQQQQSTITIPTTTTTTTTTTKTKIINNKSEEISNEIVEAKPRLPPKKKPRPILNSQPESVLQINQTDLQFLNMSLRNRIDTKAERTHNISFTFNEEQCEKSLEELEQETAQHSLLDFKQQQQVSVVLYLLTLLHLKTSILLVFPFTSHTHIYNSRPYK